MSFRNLPIEPSESGKRFGGFQSRVEVRLQVHVERVVRDGRQTGIQWRHRPGSRQGPLEALRFDPDNEMGTITHQRPGNQKSGAPAVVGYVFRVVVLRITQRLAVPITEEARPE